MAHPGREPGDHARPGGPRPRLKLSNWKAWAPLALVALAAIVLVGRAASAAAMNDGLLRAPRGGLPSKALVDFAVAQAKPDYAHLCASCHGADMKGDPARGIPNLADDDWLYGTGQVEELQKTISYGVRSGHPRAWNLAEMPGFARAVPAATYKTDPLTPQELNDVVDYVMKLGNHPVNPAGAARGAALFANKAQCFDCHTEDGGGDPAIGAPNLTDAVWLYGDGSRKAIYSTIAHGRRGSCPAWILKLSPGRLRSMAIYIYTASHKAA